MSGRSLLCACLWAISFSAAACSPPAKVDSLADRLRDSKNVFLAQVHKVEFKTAGYDDKRGTVLVIGLDGQQSRSFWWEGSAVVGQVFRGQPPSTINLRFNGNWCGGVEFHPGDWYLFVLGDLRRGEFVVTDRDWAAVRHFSNYTLPIEFEPKNFAPIVKIIKGALEATSAKNLEHLERVSDGIGGVPPPPPPSK